MEHTEGKDEGDLVRRQERHEAEKVLFSISRKDFAHVVFPIVAGIPTAILILYAFDLGRAFENILNNLISPVITGVVSGFILYVLGIKR